MTQITSSHLPFVGKHMRYPDETGGRLGEGGRRTKGVRRADLPGRPLVTVITVCWNSARTLEKAMLSVFGQTYDNIEYVVVDGGSKDATLQLLQTHEERIAYFVSEPDEGLYQAMNKGLELAQGSYILMLNSDDWYEPDTVAKLVAAMEYGACDFTGALARYVNANGTSHVLRSMPFDHSVLLRMPLRHETMLIPAALYDKIGPYDVGYPIIADYDFTVRLFQAGATYCEVREPLLNFTTEGVSSTAKDQVNAEMRKLVSRIFPFLEPADLMRLTDHENLGPETFIDLANANLDQPDFVRAVRTLLKDRQIHSGPRWKSARLETLAAAAPLQYPEVSVIVPFHNSEGSIAATLDTALSQDLKEIEVVCVDDHGTDGSRRIVEQYIARDKRVRLVRNPENLGPGGSRNTGIRAARGRYVFFLDSDDAILPNALRVLLDTARAHDSTIVRGAFTASQQVHGQKGSGAVKHIAGVTEKPLINTTLKQTPGLLATTEGHWAALYDADFVETVLYPQDIHVGEDSLFLVKAQALAPAISVVPNPVYHYKANPNSTMNNLTAAKYFDGLTWRARACDLLLSAKLRPCGEQLLFNFWSQAYFDGLEKTLTDAEKSHYFSKLHEAFARAGWPRAGATKDTALRTRLIDLIAEFGHVRPPVVVEKDPSRDILVTTFTTQDHGGAGIGSQRRVEALRRSGIDARIYCGFRKSTHDYVTKLPYARPLAPDAPYDNAWQAWSDATVLRRAEHPSLKARELFSKTGSIVDFRDIAPVFDQADIVHLHWVAGIFDYANTEALADKPVVWTLADMNAFTGGCHYSEGCEGYKSECRDCPLLGENKDVAHETWKTKRDGYAKIKNLHVICPSQWLADCARQSSLFGDRPVHMIPNALPVDRFTPTNRLVARRRLKLPLDRKLVVFGAESLSNLRKGGDILAKSIEHLKQMGKAGNVAGLFFGSSELDLGIETHMMGHVSDEEKMSLIYAAADVFAFPSREDNAPLTVIESMLSGTPVVGFPVGNVPELVVHEDTGYIAKYADPEDFAKGLAWALTATESPEALLRSLRGHVKARRHNDPSTAVARHIALYRGLLGGAVAPQGRDVEQTDVKQQRLLAE